MNCVVALVDQRFPVLLPEINSTFPPVQKVVGPLAEIVGVDGNEITLIVALAEDAEWQPLALTACTK